MRLVKLWILVLAYLAAMAMSACGGGGGGGAGSAPTPSTLSVAFAPKQLRFTWTAATGAVSYRLLESPDGVAALAQVGPDIAAPTTSSDLDIPSVHRKNWAARYALDACNASGCTRSDQVTVESGSVAAVGYFKSSNSNPVDQFGQSVAVSSDGNTIAVGAPFEDGAATGVDGQSTGFVNNSGAVYVFTRIGGVWAQQAYVKASNTGAEDRFGWSVALSGDGTTLAVGASNEDSNAIGIGGDQGSDSAPAAGAVYVFTRTAGPWAQQAYIKASNAGTGDGFGTSVALNGNGDTLAVGAGGETSGSPGIDGDQSDNSVDGAGAVYLFTRTAGAWSQEAYVKASNPGTADFFGWSTGLSSDGNTLAVGAINEASIDGDQADNTAFGTGAAYVFTRAAGAWSQQAYIKASNPGGLDQFGYSTALSGDGNTLAVSAYLEDSNATGVGGDEANNAAADSGAAYVFTRTAGVWSQQAYIKASNAEAGDQFGFSAALSGDGNTLAVGAIGEGSNATGVGGNQADNSAAQSGAVYVFARAANAWSQQSYVKASNAETNDWFGAAIGLSSDGNTMMVGAYLEDGASAGIGGDQADNGSDTSGAAYLY